MVFEIESFEREKITVLPNFLETTGRNVATEGDIAKTASSRPSHCIFCVVSQSSLLVNQYPQLYFWLQKSSITSTVTAEFKVQSEQHMRIYTFN